MAGNADGSVIIKIDLSSNDAEKELSRLKKKFLSLEDDLTVGQHRKDALTKRLELIDRQIDGINRKKVEFGGSGISDSEAYALESLTKSANEIDMAIQRQNKSLEDTQMAIDGVKMRYEEVRALAEQTAAEADSSSRRFSWNSDAITQKFSRIHAVLQPIISTARNGISNIFHGLKSCAAQLGKMFSGISNIFQGLKSCTAQLGKMFIGSKSLSKSFGGVWAAVKRIAPALLAARGIMGMLRKAVNAYMQQNQQLANTLSSAWTGLGNILGPIIERMVNLLANAVAYFTKFLSLLGFTGKAATKQINSAGGAAKKETEELKKSLLSFDTLEILSDKEEESGGGGGGGAYIDLTDSRNVELPNWAKRIAEQFKSGEWAEAAKTLTSTLNDMIDKVDWNAVGEKLGYWLDSAMTFLATAVTTFDWIDLGDKLATAVNGIVKNVNWSNLGTLLSAKFQIAFETLAGFINGLDMPEMAEALSSIATSWIDVISSTLNSVGLEQLGKQIETLLDGMIANIDWNYVGENLGYWLDSAMTFLVTTVTGFDWTGLGEKLATAVNGIVENVDWTNLGTLLWAKVKIALETLAGFITNLDMPALADALSSVATGFFDTISDTLNSINWQDIGTQLKDLLTNINWADIADSVFAAVGAALASLAELIVGAFEEAWDNAVKWWDENAFQDGKFTIDGLLNGILEALKNIATWVKDHIVQPIIDGFKNAFGIHSPSTVMKELGGYIIDGLLEGLKAAWVAVQEWINTALASVNALFDSVDAIKGERKSTTEGIAEYLMTALSENTYSPEQFSKFLSDKVVSGEWHFTDVRNALNEIFSGMEVDGMKVDMEQIGIDSSGGLIDGIISTECDVSDTVEDLVKKGIIDKAKSILDINSPSVVMKEVGGYVVDGLVNGLNEFSTKIAPWQSSFNVFIAEIVTTAQESANAITAAFSGISFPSINGFANKISYIPNARMPFLANPPIPHLASGAVIPPRAPFLAVLGDQRNGTNIEAPLSAIQEATASREMLAAMKAINDTLNRSFDNLLYAVANIDDSKIGKMANRYNRSIDRAFGR